MLLQENCDALFELEGLFMSQLILFNINLALFLKTFDLFLVVLDFPVKLRQKFIILCDLYLIFDLYLEKCLDCFLYNCYRLILRLFLRNQNSGFLYLSPCVVFGFFAIFFFKQRKNFLHKLKRLSIIFQFKITIRNQPQSLNIVKVRIISWTAQLNVMCLF